MSESTTSQYQKLFEVRLLHHYWLDNGSTVFDNLSAGEQDKQLLLYDVRKIIAIEPTASSRDKLAGLKCVFKSTTIGFIIAVPKGVKVPANTVLEFSVTVVDPAFFSYTSLSLAPRTIHEFQYESQNTTLRYKKNIPLLSNATGQSRGVGVNKKLFLSAEYSGAAAGILEDLLQNGNNLNQVKSDTPAVLTQNISNQLANSPIYIHQGDVPTINAPAGILNTPTHGILLKDEIPDDVLLMIRIEMTNPMDQDYNVIDGTLLPLLPSPIFQVRFKNRSTLRRYIDKRTNAITQTEPNPTPLTARGNSGAGPKPTRGVVKMIPISNAVNAPVQLISEIYI